MHHKWPIYSCFIMNIRVDNLRVAKIFGDTVRYIELMIDDLLTWIFQLPCVVESM